MHYTMCYSTLHKMVPHARIRAGDAGSPAFLLRPDFFHKKIEKKLDKKLGVLILLQAARMVNLAEIYSRA